MMNSTLILPKIAIQGYARSCLDQTGFPRARQCSVVSVRPLRSLENATLREFSKPHTPSRWLSSTPRDTMCREWLSLHQNGYRDSDSRYRRRSCTKGTRVYPLYGKEERSGVNLWGVEPCT